LGRKDTGFWRIAEVNFFQAFGGLISFFSPLFASFAIPSSKPGLSISPRQLSHITIGTRGEILETLKPKFPSQKQSKSPAA